MTGETDPLKKDTLETCIAKRDEVIQRGDKGNAGPHEVPSPILMSGTNTLTGDGKMVAIVVGKKSCVGRIKEKLKDDPDDATPLQ